MARRTVEIVAHDPAWLTEFGQLAAVLAEHLGDRIVAIEHVGSTAVPGLMAKPILDVDAVIPAPGLLSDVVRLLAELGYDHRGDLGVAGREAFGRMMAEVPFTPEGRSWTAHHLYVCVDGSTELRRHRAFRDILRSDPRVAREYGDLKTRLAARHKDDRESYTHGKSNFIEAVLSR